MNSNSISPLVPEATDLISRARSIRKKFDPKQRSRPLLVEFAGTPKSGKSTCIEVVSHFFHRLNFKVFAPTEGVSRRTPRHLKTDLLYYNTWAACYALMQMFEAKFHSDRYDIAIFDRGIFDFLAWIDWLCEAEHRIDHDLREQLHKFILLEPWTNMMDLVILFRCSPETSLKRENQNKLLEKSGRAMNPDALRSLNVSYERVHEQFSSRFSAFVTIDTTEDELGSTQRKLQQIAITICDTMLGVMEAEVE